MNLSQSILTAGIIFFAFLTKGSFITGSDSLSVTGKIILGIGPVFPGLERIKGTLFEPRLVAQSHLNICRLCGSFHILPSVQTLSATVNLLVRDSELLWVALFLSPLEVGYYKTASGGNQLYHHSDHTIYQHDLSPKSASSVGQKAVDTEVRRVIRRVTLVAGIIDRRWCPSGVIIIFGQISDPFLRQRISACLPHSAGFVNWLWSQQPGLLEPPIAAFIA